jgi:hypothetical protein
MTGLLAAGLVVAGFAQCLALLMTGAGHGWITPFFYSPALFVAYPIVLVRIFGKDSGAPRRRWLAVDLLLVAAAVLLDFLLVRTTLDEGIQYVERVMAVPPLPHLWVLLWVAWQALAVGLLAARALEPRERGRGPRDPAI